jgi:ketosteroid isomerase-like protein
MNRSIFVIACLALGACAPADNEENVVVADSAAVVANDTAAIAAEVRVAVEKFYDVLTTGGTSEALDPLLHPALITVHGNGMQSTHDERIANHTAGRVKVTSRDHDIVAVQLFGNDFALAHMDTRSAGSLGGQAWPSGAKMILGFARTGAGPWELVYHQIVQDKPGSI